MKKQILFILVLVLGLAVFGTTSMVSADDGNPPGGGVTGGGWKGTTGQDGFMGRGGIIGRSGKGGDALHGFLVAEFAKVAGITPEAFQAKLDGGMTILQVLREAGLTDEAIKEQINIAYKAALDAAVAEGVLTQEQADWLQQKHEKVFANGALPQNDKTHGTEPWDDGLGMGRQHGNANGHQKQANRGKGHTR